MVKTQEDWAIRSQAPKSVMIGYGEGSETRWSRVLYDGLINLKQLKIQSNPLGKLSGIHNG